MSSQKAIRINNKLKINHNTPAIALGLTQNSYLSVYLTCTILNSIRGKVIVFSIVEALSTMFLFLTHFWNIVAIFINISLEKQYGYININERIFSTNTSISEL